MSEFRHKPIGLTSDCRFAPRLAFIALAAFAVVARQEAIAWQLTDQLLPAITGDTVAVITWQTDADSLDLDLLVQVLGSLNPELELSEFMNYLAASGVNQAARVVKLSDQFRGRNGPILIFDRASFDPSDDSGLAEVIVPQKSSESFAIQAWQPPPAIAIASQADELDAANATALREQFADAWNNFEGRKIRIVLAAGPDQRRVMSAFLPRLWHEVQKTGSGSDEAAAFDASQFANKFRWLAVGVDSTASSDPVLQVRIAMADEASATSAAAMIPAVRDLTRPLFRESNPDLFKLAESLSPAATVSGNFVDVRLVDGRGNEVAKQLVDATAMDAASSNIRQDLRNLVISFHNYHDVYKHLPVIGSRSADGKPLLSWRVHVLPLIGQGALYKQFHLDEPWDSPHNKTLIAKMPPIFSADRSSNSSRKGLSNYLMPNGNGAVFRDFEPRTLTEISDGTSRTAMLVEVGDDQAEIWTKPGGWVFDPDNPVRGLGGHIPGRIHVGRADGSIVVLPPDYESFAELFTADAGDEIK